MHEVRKCAEHADIRTTELHFVRKEEDAKWRHDGYRSD